MKAKFNVGDMVIKILPRDNVGNNPFEYAKVEGIIEHTTAEGTTIGYELVVYDPKFANPRSLGTVAERDLCKPTIEAALAKIQENHEAALAKAEEAHKARTEELAEMYDEEMSHIFDWHDGHRELLKNFIAKVVDAVAEEVEEVVLSSAPEVEEIVMDIIEHN